MQINLTFSADGRNRFDDLVNRTTSSPEEVIMNALRLYEDAIKQASLGSKFQLVAKDGEVSSWDIF